MDTPQLPSFFSKALFSFVPVSEYKQGIKSNIDKINALQIFTKNFSKQKKIYCPKNLKNDQEVSYSTFAHNQKDQLH